MSRSRLSCSVAVEAGRCGDDAAAAFRDAMSATASTVSLISARGQAGPAAITATSVTSLSDSPASLLVCLNRRSRLIAALEQSGRFLVNVLRSEQIDLAKAFSRPMRGTDEFDPQLWDCDAKTAPALRGAIVTFDCKIVNSLSYATHNIYIAEVEFCRIEDGIPLIYLQREYTAPRKFVAPALASSQV